MNNIENNVAGEVGSVGAPGIEARSFGRYYLTSPWGIEYSADTLNQSLRIAQSAIERNRSISGMGGPEHISRCVGRFLVADRALPDISENPELLHHIEVVLPTSMSVGGLGPKERVWLMTLGLNHTIRRSIVPCEDMIQQVQRDRLYQHNEPVKQIMDLGRDGYTFIDSMVGRTNEVAGLWGSAFGWTSDGVEMRQDTIERQLALPGEARGSWFAGLVDPSGRLVSAAVAERLDMTTGLIGQSLPIVELSEWRRSDQVERRGLMAATNAYLIAQVLEDLSSLRTKPVLFAETNFMSRAHRVGFASGMDVAQVEIAGRHIPQILVQNVEVGDSYTPVGLRDFTVMHLPQTAARQFYSEGRRVAILGEARVFERRTI